MARATELLVEELGDELLLYDQRNDRVHCLSSAAGKVWRACDGKTSVEQLGSALKLDSGLVDQALGELEGHGLLDGEPASGVTRREATMRLAKIGAAAAAAPLISSIAAPTPAMAATACGTGTRGCVGSTTAPNLNTCANAAQCSTANCACCVTSGNQCTHGTQKTSFSACISACGSGCTVSYVFGLCAGNNPTPATACGTPAPTGTHCS